MRDFNFFAPYLNTKKDSKSGKTFTVVTAVVGVLIVGSLVWNSANMFLLNKRIDELKGKINDPELQSQLKKSEELAKKSYDLKNLNGDLNDIYKYIETRTLVKTELMAQVNSTLPEGISLKTLTVDRESIQMQAVSKSRQAIGEFQHNLKNINKVKEVYVSNINSDLATTEGQFNFSIKCLLKDVDNNENK